MSLFDDAAEFMKNRTPAQQEDKTREDLIRRLRSDFENATRLEIERGLNKLEERGGIPSDYDELVDKIRVWVED